MAAGIGLRSRPSWLPKVTADRHSPQAKRHWVHDCGHSSDRRHPPAQWHDVLLPDVTLDDVFLVPDDVFFSFTTPRINFSAFVSDGHFILARHARLVDRRQPCVAAGNAEFFREVFCHIFGRP